MQIGPGPLARLEVPGAERPVTVSGVVYLAPGGSNVFVQAIGAGTAGVVYQAEIVATPLVTPGAAPTGIRIDHEPSNLDSAGGAGRAARVSKLPCQDELFAVSNDGSACTLSVIYLYEVAGAG